MSARRVERTPLVQGSPEWHEWRRTGVGSSDIPVITGDAHYGDVATLYQEKLGYTATRVETDFMAAGKRLEKVIAGWYQEDTGHPVRTVNFGLRDRERRFMIASLDREATIVGKRRPLEIKTAAAPGDEWGKTSLDNPSDVIPDRYLEQVQWQAAVSGADVVDLAVFFFSTRRWEPYRIGRDQGVIDELVEYGAAFWRCVETRTAPEPVEHRLRLPLRADEIEADEALIELVELHDELHAEKDAAEASLAEVKAELRQKLDDVGGVRGPGFRVHYRHNADSTVTNWEAVAGAYRTRLELVASTLVAPSSRDDVVADLDDILADLTSLKPGARPLVVRRQKEKTRAA